MKHIPQTMITIPNTEKPYILHIWVHWTLRVLLSKYGYRQAPGLGQPPRPYTCAWPTGALDSKLWRSLSKGQQLPKPRESKYPVFMASWSHRQWEPETSNVGTWTLWVSLRSSNLKGGSSIIKYRPRPQSQKPVTPWRPRYTTRRLMGLSNHVTTYSWAHNFVFIWGNLCKASQRDYKLYARLLTSSY